MKKTIMVLAIFFLIANVAYAGSTRQNCGCGLGSMLFEGQNGLMSQTAAYTTNGTFGNQSLGITSGTLGCDSPQSFTKNETLNIFVAENMDNLASDIASGKGESLDTLAELIELPAEKRPAFFAALQGDFDRIYPSAQVTHTDVIEKIASIVREI